MKEEQIFITIGFGEYLYDYFKEVDFEINNLISLANLS